MFLEQPVYRPSEAQNNESSEDLTVMYSQIVLRNKRFKPSFPLREPESAPEQALVEDEHELVDDSD